jgi:hypothetical protein
MRGALARSISAGHGFWFVDSEEKNHTKRRGGAIKVEPNVRHSAKSLDVTKLCAPS